MGKPRFLALQLLTKRQRPDDVRSQLAELESLVDTYGGTVAQTMLQRRDIPDRTYYFGKGKIEEIKHVVKDSEISVIVINDLVKPTQLFRLEKELWAVDPSIHVWDRLDLILHIFDQHAQTRESQLQIALARLAHAGPRIYGLGKTRLSKQEGGIGGRGKGETNIEFERRIIKSSRQDIQKELKKLNKNKQARMDRRAQQGIGPVALVGYTSAGKTTLFNTLTGKEKEKSAGLFTTLDTVVGKMKSPNLELPILISDTIGFIQNLPPQLLESFKSTLLESLQARVLLHVVDSADPLLDQKIVVVQEILSQLNVTQPVLMVYNKIDRLTQEQRSQIPNMHGELPVFALSAHTGEGIDELKQAVETLLAPEA